MRNLNVVIVLVALSLVGWKTKDIQNSELVKNYSVALEYNINSAKLGDSVKLKEVKLTLKPGAGDVAKIELLTVKDALGLVIIEKFVPNNSKAILKFKVNEDLKFLKIEYGTISRKVKLKDGLANFNFRSKA